MRTIQAYFDNEPFELLYDEKTKTFYDPKKMSRPYHVEELKMMNVILPMEFLDC